MKAQHVLFMVILILVISATVFWYSRKQQLSAPPETLTVTLTDSESEPLEAPEETASQAAIPIAPALSGSTMVADTGESVEAEVRLIPVNGDALLITTFTDEDGRFVFQDLPANTYQVFAEAPGLLSFSGKRDLQIVEIGKDTTSTEPLVLALKPAAGVTVRVVSKQTGEGVAGAHVKVPELLRVYRASETGEVRLYLPPEIWQLTVDAEGYQGREVLVGFSGQTARSYQVALTPESAGAVPETVRGEVVDEAGNPIANARLIFRTTGSDPPERALADSGEFQIERPELGVTLIFQAPGFAPHRLKTWPKDKNFSRIVLKTYRVFHGRVVDGKDDRPVPRFTLNASKHARGSEIQSKDGSFRLDHRHPADPVYLTVAAPGFAEGRFGPFDPAQTSETQPAVLRLEALPEDRPE